jgi:hypothetical protein
MKWAALLLIIILSACRSGGHACIINAADILKGAPKKLITTRDAGNKIIALYDLGWDTLNGGAYLFYPNELLKSYSFYQNKAAVYSENYDENGFLTHTQGSPMVNRVINELGTDSAYVQVYFYKILKSYQKLNIEINHDAPVNYNLTDDTTYSNMKSVVFGMNTTGLKHVSMYTRIKYMDDCAKIEHVLSDSLFLMKDSLNELVPSATK